MIREPKSGHLFGSVEKCGASQLQWDRIMPKQQARHPRRGADRQDERRGPANTHHELEPVVSAARIEHSDLALVGIRDVCDLIRLSPSWVYAEVAQGRFPQPLRLSSRCSRWKLSAVRAWLAQRSTGNRGGA